MSSSSTPLRRFAFKAAVILVSALVWLACWQLAQAVFSFSRLPSGITLIYVPAGVRLVLLLIAGIWGAIGIVLAFPFAVLQVFPNMSWQEAAAYSVIAGFIPYATVLGVCRAARVTRDLSTLRTIHLPLLAAAVSMTGALAYTIALIGFGRLDAARFLPDVTAMTAGDFLGCFAVIVLVRVAISGGRKSR